VQGFGRNQSPTTRRYCRTRLLYSVGALRWLAWIGCDECRGTAISEPTAARRKDRRPLGLRQGCLPPVEEGIADHEHARSRARKTVGGDFAF
jgi:hypothetical protein